MKRFTLPGALLIAMLIVGSARAQLHCDLPAVQTGEVHTGAALSHRFVVVNNGKETIEILDAKPSCGCLAPRIDQRVLAPGARGALEVDVNTLTQDAGPQSWRVTVRYREGHADHELDLRLAATIVTTVTVTPPSIVLHTTSAIGHELTLTDRRLTPLNVTAVQPSSPHMRAQLGEWKKDDDGFAARTIAIEVLPEFPTGRHEEIIQIFSSDPEYREIRIPITIVKKPRQTVSASPDLLTVSTTVGESIPSRVILLRSTDDQDVVVDRIDCDSAAVSCKATAGPGHRSTLKIQLDRTKIGGDSLETKLRVVLRQPPGQVVTVPLTWSER
jgi:hypothetical protein